MSFIRTFFRSVLFLATSIASIFFILSAYSDYISPKFSVIPSFLGILFPFFLLVEIFFLILGLFRMKWCALLSLLSLLICWEPITRYVPFHRDAQQLSDNHIKLLTYNTCGLGQNNNNNYGKEILNFINDENPDIVCLQEYTFFRRPDGLNEAKIRKILSKYPYYHYKASASSYNTGLALFSKYPIKRVHGVNYESLYNSSVLYELDVNGERLTLINNHLESNQLSKEDREFYNQMILHLDSVKLNKIRSTLAHKLSKAYRIRSEQADTIHNIIQRVKTPIIVCGDFNDTPISYCYQRIRGNLHDAYRESGWGPGITYHENHFLFRIDHIFYSNQFKAHNAKVHHVLYSDHYPVTVSLSRQK